MTSVFGCLSFFCCVKLWPAVGGLTDKGPAVWKGGGEFGWEMDALSIMEALGDGLRSRHVEVRERWSVRSQHSWTTPDLSSRQEKHRMCLWWQLPEYLLPLWAKSNVLTRRKGIEKGPVRMMSVRGFGEWTRPMGGLEQDPVLADRKKSQLRSCGSWVYFSRESKERSITTDVFHLYLYMQQINDSEYVDSWFIHILTHRHKVSSSYTRKTPSHTGWEMRSMQRGKMENGGGEHVRESSHAWESSQWVSTSCRSGELES